MKKKFINFSNQTSPLSSSNGLGHTWNELLDNVLSSPGSPLSLGR